MNAGRKKKDLDAPRMKAILVSVAALTRMPRLGFHALVCETREAEKESVGG